LHGYSTGIIEAENRWSDWCGSVDAAVHARALAVPHGEHAVVLGRADQVHLLRTPYRGGGQVFVHARDELHVVRFQVRLGFPQVFVQAAQGRAAVAGNETGGIQACGEVALALHHRQAHQRLYAGKEDVAGSCGVFVVEGDRGQATGRGVRHVKLQRVFGFFSPHACAG
jgi:hypothetical protein